MKKLIAITALAVFSIIVLISAKDGQITQHLTVNKNLSGTVFDPSLPAEHIMSLNNLGRKGDDFIAIEIKLLGDKSQIMGKNQQTYQIENHEGITISSVTLAKLASSTKYKITKVVISQRAGKQDMSDIQHRNGTW